MIRIFDDGDGAQIILDHVLDSDIAGISGGRLSVRRRLGEVSELAVTQGHGAIRATSTYNHPDTELAFIFHDDVYTFDEAMAAVIQAYDLDHPSE